MPDPNTNEGLLSLIRDSFSRGTSKYNEVHRVAVKMAEQEQKHREQGIVWSGIRQMILNRYHGVMTFRDLLVKADDGAAWAWYFARSPALEIDVRQATLEWLRSISASVDVRPLLRAAITAGATTDRDLNRLRSATEGRVRMQVQSLGVSVVTGVAISQLLKHVGTTAESEATRSFALAARRVWAVSGVLALAYGLGQISDAIHESGEFAKSLQVRRDAFNTKDTAKIRAIMEQIRIAYQETGRYDGP